MRGLRSTADSVNGLRRRTAAAGVVLMLATLGLPVRASGLPLPASCTSFTDNPLVAGTTPIKAVHLTQLRTCIADLRAAAGLSAVAWTDPVLTPGVTLAKAVHVTELRTALAAVFATVGLAAPTYSTSPGAGAIVSAADLNELRSVLPTLASPPTCTDPPTGLSPNAASFGSTGGQGTTALGSPSGCSYTATSNVPWLTITSAATTTISYQVALNDTLDVRSGTLTIAGLTFTVTQAAADEVVTYLDTDAVGSVRMATNAAGQVVARYDYLPFGTLWPTNTQTSETRLFGGKERDAESGSDYFGGRFLSNTAGRFTTVDPNQNLKTSLFEPQRWNGYSYALNNPIRLVDPDGREVPVSVGGRLVGMGTELTSAGATESQKWAAFGALSGIVLGVGGAGAALPVVSAALQSCIFSFGCQSTMALLGGVSALPGIASGEAVLLGETAIRVESAAVTLRLGFFRGSETRIPDDELWAMNLRWLEEQIAAGKRVFDIGLHMGREGPPGKFYPQEVGYIKSAGFKRVFLGYKFVGGRLEYIYEWLKQ